MIRTGAFLLLTLLVAPLRAQVPDTVQTAPPQQRPRPLRIDSLLSFDDVEPGGLADSLPPVLRPFLEATDVLASVPGSFVYAFETPGWPDAWSPLGLSPQRPTLLFNGLPFDDAVTGRPRYDLLPFDLLAPLRTAPTRHGAPAAVYAEARPFASTRPLTELRYRTGGDGLQSITALHTQQRRLPLFGRPGLLGLLGAYGGRAADGEYPGSRLRRERRIFGRLRYQQPRWALEFFALHNRHRLGAHGGVEPRGAFETVYIRFGADVRDPDASRRTMRTDLGLTARLGLAARPLTLTLFRTVQTFRYRNPAADTLQARTRRYGFRAQQDARLGPQRLRFRMEGWTDRLAAGSNAFAEDGLSAQQLHAAVRDSLALPGVDLVAEASLHTGEGDTFVGGLAAASVRLGAGRLFAEGAYAGQRLSWVERYGFGAFLSPVAEVPQGRVAQGRAGIEAPRGPFDATLFAFAYEISDALDLYVTTAADADTVAARVSTEPFRRAGLAADLGWRRHAERGLYLTLQSTLARFLNATSPDQQRVEATLPEVFGRGRLGVRALLFRGDLDLDLYLLGQFWSELRSRRLHPATGLLVVPAATARTFGPNGTLSIYAEAGVRTATFFLAYENFLSGTVLQPGVLLVPVYPLPERRLRFGLFWPILN